MDRRVRHGARFMCWMPRRWTTVGSAAPAELAGALAVPADATGVLETVGIGAVEIGLDPQVVSTSLRAGLATG